MRMVVVPLHYSITLIVDLDYRHTRVLETAERILT
jgi:hypothetical protein